ncbi:MAG: TlpA disulfide reductase family protein [Pirellulales bacterium]
MEKLKRVRSALPCCILAGCAVVALSGPGCNSSKSTTAGADAPRTADEVLKRMVSAYRGAKSYSDVGRLRIQFKGAENRVDETVDFAVSLVRPNKIRLNVYQAEVACDGTRLQAKLADLPGQILDRPAPEKLTLSDLYDQPILGDVLTQGIAGASVQVALLLDEAALDHVLQNAEKPKLLAAKEVHGDLCHRVEVNRPEGALVLWIDQKTYVVRRLEYPTDDLRRHLKQEFGDVTGLSLVADLKAARLDSEVAARSFSLDVPRDARLVGQLNLLEPPSPLLGRQVAGFRFTGLDGEPITRQSLSGRIAVIDFWNTASEWCLKDLPNLDHVYNERKSDAKIAFLAVSIDDAKVSDRELTETLRRAGVSLPVARNAGDSARDAFDVQGVPTIVILGADGRVQDYIKGYKPELASELPGKLDKLLSGAELFKETIRQYESLTATASEAEIPRAEIAERGEPSALELAALWTCDKLKKPGNVLALERGNGGTRLVVLDGWRAAAELDARGDVVRAVELPLPAGPEEAVVSYLRTATDSAGKRFFVASGPSQQQLHVFDDAWKLLRSFPPEGKHAGISDVQLADLDADGQPEILVGYWGVVGVHSVSLEGSRRWATRRSLESVLRLAVTGPDADGRRRVLAAHIQGSLLPIDFDGLPGQAIQVPNRFLRSIYAADLDGDGQVELSAIAFTGPGHEQLIGLSQAGSELWSYPLPEGVQPNPALEMLTWGRLSEGEPACWVVAGPDGSIHFLTAHGTLIDRFNYGSVINGLALAPLDGQPALIVSTAGRVEVWRIERK